MSFIAFPYLVDVLAIELGEELLEALVISLNADGAEDGLDIVSRRGGVATEAEEEVSGEVLHFGRSVPKSVSVLVLSFLVRLVDRLVRGGNSLMECLKNKRGQSILTASWAEKDSS